MEEAPDSVIVFGSTGNQGSSTLKHLYASIGKTLDIYAVTRDPSNPRSRQLASVFPGVQVVPGDFEDKESIKRVFKSVTSRIRSIFLISTPSLASQGYALSSDLEIAVFKNIIDVAAESGIRHIVLSSIAGCDNTSVPAHYKSKKAIEDHLKASGIRYVHSRKVY